VTTLAYFLSSTDTFRPSGAISGDGDMNAPAAQRAARDAAWMARIATGEERALEALYVAYYRHLRGFAKTFVRSAETAEEVVHDVFLSIWERRATLAVRDVRAYLFRAVRLRAIDFARTERAAERADREAILRDVLRSAEALVPDADAPDQQMVAAEIRVAVATVIDTMPRVRATAARLRWVDNLTIAEIAAVMGIAVPAAQMHVSRAKTAVAGVLERFLDR
jgi:RNA polymerase sigma factor (sigma-70 family)